MQFRKLKKKNRKNKTINDYAKLIQSIRKEYQRLALENELLKKYEKNRRQAVYHWLNREQQKTNWIFWTKKKKENIKNNTALKAVAKTASLSITYQKKENKKKW